MESTKLQSGTTHFYTEIASYTSNSQNCGKKPKPLCITNFLWQQEIRILTANGKVGGEGRQNSLVVNKYSCLREKEGEEMKQKKAY